MLRLDPNLVCAVRHEHARDEIARGGVRQLAVLPEVSLPPLGLFTRRSGLATSPVVLEFAQAIRAAGGTAATVGAPAGRRATRRR